MHMCKSITECTNFVTATLNRQ